MLQLIPYALVTLLLIAGCGGGGSTESSSDITTKLLPAAIDIPIHWSTVDDGVNAFTATFGTDEADRGRAVIQVSDGGFVVVGDYGNNIAVQNAIGVTKLDQDGSQVWSRYFDGQSYSDDRCLAETSEGNILICVSGQVSGSRPAILSVAPNDGQLQWMKYTDYFFTHLTPTSDGNVIGVGMGKRQGRSDFDVYVEKFSPKGKKIWSKFIDDSRQNIGLESKETAGGDYVVSGLSCDFLDEAGNIDYPLNNFFMAKLDSAGHLLWSDSAAGSGGQLGGFVHVTEDDRYVFYGGG